MQHLPKKYYHVITNKYQVSESPGKFFQGDYMLHITQDSKPHELF